MFKEFQAIGYVCIAGAPLPLRYASGWWDDQNKAKAELDYELEKNLPSGLYQVSINVIER